MEKSSNFKSQSFIKNGIVTLAFAAVASLVAAPLVAQADCDHGHWDKAKHSEFMEKHQKELHEKLALSASQAPAWNNFVTNSKPKDGMAKPDWSELSKLSTPDRLDRMLAMMKDHEKSMESHVQVVKAFYAQLTPAQKKTFDDSFHHEHGEHDKHGPFR